MKKNILFKSMLTIALVTPLISGCSKQLDVKNNMNVELGTPISTNIKDYLNENAKDQDKIIQEGKLSITDDKKVEGKDYQPVGDYIVKITYDGKDAEVKVSVKDTVKPVFKEFKDTIDIYKDEKVDFNKLFVAEDLSKVTITIDDSKVDYTKEGTYKATVTATDEAKNTETKEITVNVKKPEIKLDNTSKTLYEKESFVIKADVKGKDSKVTFKSSDYSIASVSEDGKVVAKKKGVATITASANGVEAKCEVNVKERPLSPKEKRLQEAKIEAKRVASKLNLNSLSEYDRAYKIGEYLYTNVDIQDNQSNEAYRKNFGNEAYAALILKKAACSGFCKAVTLLCQECNLEVKHINANQWKHQWNMVKVDGKWIVLDAQGGFFGMSEHPLENNDYIVSEF